jgi:3-polyprenyl-4-hydroxybenzoate decarboxylase
MPAMPAFYYQPKTIADTVEQFCCRVLAHVGLPQEKQYRWKGKNDRASTYLDRRTRSY